jgi:hypothetical protein
MTRRISQASQMSKKSKTSKTSQTMLDKCKTGRQVQMLSNSISVFSFFYKNEISKTSKTRMKSICSP